MPTYIIGDVQGCYSQLRQLLDYIAFDPAKDRLGFAGDLVNRGPESLETLRFISSLPNPLVVLGNHDLYLLERYARRLPADDVALQAVLDASDGPQLCEWLRTQPLLLYPEEKFCLVHAGIPPQWSIPQAQQLAEEVSVLLAGEQFAPLMDAMFGNEPSTWRSDLSGWGRYRYILNALTRLRFCTEQGELDLMNKTAETTDPKFQAWWQWRSDPCSVLYGHWAALQGQSLDDNYVALDTGCVYGGRLTALRIDDHASFSVSCVRK